MSAAISRTATGWTGNRTKATRRTGSEGAINLRQRRIWGDGVVGDQAIVGDGAAGPGGAGSSEAPPDWARDPAKAYAEVQAARREAAEFRTRLREIEKSQQAAEGAKKAEAEKTLAEQAQWKTLADQRAAELEKLRGELSAAQRSVLIERIARESGLPAAIAARLQGTTEEELRADADAIRKELKLGGVPGASTNTTSVPGGAPAGTSDSERRARYFGYNSTRDQRSAGSGGGEEMPTSFKFGG